MRPDRGGMLSTLRKAVKLKITIAWIGPYRRLGPQNASRLEQARGVCPRWLLQSDDHHLLFATFTFGERMSRRFKRLG